MLQEKKAVFVLQTSRKLYCYFPHGEKWKVLHKLSLHTSVDFMQIDSLRLNLFDWRPWYSSLVYSVCFLLVLLGFFFLPVFFDHPNRATYGVLRESCVYLFLCALLLVFPCSCTGCGVCPILQLSAGQDTSLVQCVTQSGLLLSARSCLVFSKGAWNGLFT